MQLGGPISPESRDSDRPERLWTLPQSVTVNPYPQSVAVNPYPRSVTVSSPPKSEARSLFYSPEATAGLQEQNFPGLWVRVLDASGYDVWIREKPESDILA